MKNVLTLSLAVALFTLGLAITASAKQKILNAEEIEALIKGKTVSVTRKRDGQKWRIYFAPNGEGYETLDAAIGIWKVTTKGKQCSGWARVKCASIADLGNGTYARLKRDGKAAVLWTKIVDGNDL